MSGAQAAFARALLDPALPPPPGLEDGAGGPVGRRFDVYRNTVVAGLCEALERGFPATAGLLGPAIFADLARRFLRGAPPASPRLMTYGAGFPEFLEAEPRLARFGYLGDVARMELLLRASYHAADAPRLAPERLAPLDGAGLAATRFVAAPATRLLASRWPVLSIHRRALDPQAPAPAPLPQAVLLARPGFDPEPQILPPGSADFAAALLAGIPLGVATASLPEGHDPAPALTLLLSVGAFCDLRLAQEETGHD